MFSLIRRLLNLDNLDIPQFLEDGAVVIDVRTPQEFDQGHADNSVNIPLAQLPNRLQDIKDLDKTVLLCCRSGMRARSALTMMKGVGIEAYNVGSWNAVQSKQTA